MKIYFAHSRNCDFVKDFYEPIRNDERLEKYNIILPHESGGSYNDREFYNDIDVFIAEVSYPVTGLGIELGWASDNPDTAVICVYKSGSKISASLEAVSSDFREYSSTDQFLTIINNVIEAKND
jgi:hypothetical protein